MGDNLEDKKRESAEANNVQDLNKRIEELRMDAFVSRIKAQNHEAASRIRAIKEIKKEQNSKYEEVENPVIEPVSEVIEEIEETPKHSEEIDFTPTEDIEEEKQKENVTEETDTELKIIVSGKGVKIGENEFSYKDLLTEDRLYGVMSIWEKCIRYETTKQVKYLEVLRKNIDMEKLEKLDFLGDQFILTALVKASHTPEELIRYMNKYYELIVPPHDKKEKKNPSIIYNLNKKAIGAKFKAWLVAKEDFPLECYEEFIEEEAYWAKDYAKVKASPIIKLKFRAKDMIEKAKQKILDKAKERAEKQETNPESQSPETAKQTELKQWPRMLSDEQRAKHDAKLEEIWSRIMKNQEEQEPEQDGSDKDFEK